MEGKLSSNSTNAPVSQCCVTLLTWQKVGILSSEGFRRTKPKVNTMSLLVFGRSDVDDEFKCVQFEHK